MISSLCTTLLADGALAAIAAAGFATVSNPPKRAIVASAVLAAIGHALQVYLITEHQVGIAIATFIAKLVRSPAEILSFPALLPMIPGLYAYKTILALMQFMQMSGAPGDPNALMFNVFKNGITALFVVFALVIGVAIPLLMFKRLSYTRQRSDTEEDALEDENPS